MQHHRLPAFAALPLLPTTAAAPRSLRKSPRSPRTTNAFAPRTTLLAPRRLLPTALHPLVLSEQSVNQALHEAKLKLASVFGNSQQNRDVGITGDVLLAALDGPIVVLRLQGRFWHKRAHVLARVSAYLLQRIPEICDVQIEHHSQLDDSEAESTRLL